MAGELGLVASGRGVFFLAEVLLDPRRARDPAVPEAARPRRPGRCARRVLLLARRGPLPAEHLPGRVQARRQLVLLPVGAGAADHLRHHRDRGRDLHRGREDLPDSQPARRSPARAAERSNDEQADRRRPDHPDRGPPANRRRGGGRHVRDAWASGQMWRGHRDHPARARPARRLAVHPALLRRVHDGARDRVGARGRERAEPRDPAQRAVHPQPDPRRPRDARPHRALLPPVGARLGGRRLGAQGRPGEDLAARREPVAVAAQRPARA